MQSSRPLSRIVLIVTAFALLGVTTAAQPPAAQSARTPAPAGEATLMAAMHSISSHTLLAYVAELASPKYTGRLTGTPGYDAAAKWSSDLLAGWNIKPAGDQGGWLQKFPNPYTLVLSPGEVSLRVPIAGTKEFIVRPYVYESDYYPGSTSDSGSVTADVVYVGYGITAPELGYDDYAGVDVKGKIVVMEPEVPVSPEPDVDLFRRWRPYSFHDYKVQNAAKHGAAGLAYNYFIVNPNCVFVKGLVWAAVGPAVVNDLFAGTGKSHDELVKTIRSTRKPASFDTNRTLTIAGKTEHHADGTGSNVVAWLPGADPVLKQEAIIIGGHLDHLGMNDRLMPGANDNASGAAVLLGAAQALATSGITLKRSVVFILFGAEEQGVRGSEFYVAHPFVPNDRVKAVINLESVGRGERISAGSARDYPELWAAIEQSNRNYIHRVVTASSNAYIARPRQDAAHFVWAKMPTVSFGTGGAKPVPYPTYHTTKDDVDLITPEIMEDLARLTFLTTVELANK
jgi:hypothetical protein